MLQHMCPAVQKVLSCWKGPPVLAATPDWISRQFLKLWQEYRKNCVYVMQIVIPFHRPPRGAVMHVSTAANVWRWWITDCRIRRHDSISLSGLILAQHLIATA